MDAAARIAALRSQCGGPRDGALLRFSLGSALLGMGDAKAARIELLAALTFDPDYSAAWKQLGHACLADGDADAAASAWGDGIATAERRGDLQAAKEMQVFRKRLPKPE